MAFDSLELQYHECDTELFLVVDLSPAWYTHKAISTLVWYFDQVGML